MPVNQKIKFLHFFPTFSPGGMENCTCRVINSLPDYFQHFIVALNGDVSCRDRILPGKEVTYPAPPKTTWINLFPIDIVRLIRQIEPDAVLTYNWGAIEMLYAARLAGVKKTIHHEHGLNSDEAMHQKVRRVLSRQVILKLATRVVVPSRSLRLMSDKAWKVNSKKLVYISNGVDPMYFSPGRASELRHQLGIGDDEMVVGTVAGLRKEKNLELLIRIFCKLPSAIRAKLLIVGNGTEGEGLFALAKKLGVADRVIFPGLAQDTAPYYQVMDVYAVSSATEQMPLSLLEAMATGLPVVSTDVGDIREMVSEGNRQFVYDIQCENDYLNGLKQLCDDANLRAILGKVNREKTVKEYSLEKQNQAYLELYEKVLGLRRA